MGQLPDKADSVRKQKLKILYHHFPDSGVKGCKQFILCEQVRLADEIHQGRLADIGIADQGYPDHFAATFSLRCHLGVYLQKLLLELRDLVTDDAAVSLYLCFTRTPHANTSELTLEVGPHARQPGKQILILGKLHLRARMRGSCTRCEYV